MDIIATVGGENSNSYVTRDEAFAYYSGRLGAESILEDPETDKIDRALITATNLLDQRMVWIGFKATTEQALEWPRVDENGDGIYVVNDVNSIPVKVKNAVFEFAKYLLENGDPINSANLDSMKVGPLTIDFNEADVTKTLIPDEIATIVVAYGQRRAAKPTIREVPLVR